MIFILSEKCDSNPLISCIEEGTQGISKSPSSSFILTEELTTAAAEAAAAAAAAAAAVLELNADTEADRLVVIVVGDSGILNSRGTSSHFEGKGEKEEVEEVDAEANAFEIVPSRDKNVCLDLIESTSALCPQIKYLKVNKYQKFKFTGY